MSKTLLRKNVIELDDGNPLQKAEFDLFRTNIYNWLTTANLLSDTTLDITNKNIVHPVILVFQNDNSWLTVIQTLHKQLIDHDLRYIEIYFEFRFETNNTLIICRSHNDNICNVVNYILLRYFQKRYAKKDESAVAVNTLTSTIDEAFKTTVSTVTETHNDFKYSKSDFLRLFESLCLEWQKQGWEPCDADIKKRIIAPYFYSIFENILTDALTMSSEEFNKHVYIKRENSSGIESRLNK